MTPLQFHQLDQAPEAPGIYAWYHQLVLSDADIEVCLRDIDSATSASDKEAVARRFLEKFVFSYYSETPYLVQIAGALKPTFSGPVPYVSEVSASLVTRIANSPMRLRTLKEALTTMVPVFSSPLYIGMAQNLRSRLRAHKRWIERLGEARLLAEEEPSLEEPDEDSKVSHSFALEAVRIRGFSTYNLRVFIQDIAIDPDIRVDVENILNRINYPLCGRN